MASQLMQPTQKTVCSFVFSWVFTVCLSVSSHCQRMQVASQDTSSSLPSPSSKIKSSLFIFKTAEGSFVFFVALLGNRKDVCSKAHDCCFFFSRCPREPFRVIAQSGGELFHCYFVLKAVVSDLKCCRVYSSLLCP